MSVVTYSKGVMAADSIALNGQFISHCDKKITILHGRFLIGVVGFAACHNMLQQQLTKEFLIENLYTGAVFQLEGKPDRYEFTALIYDTFTDKLFTLDEEGVFEEEFTNYYAIGAAEKYAIGALAAGISAEKATEICCDISIYAALPVVSFSIDDTLNLV